MRVSISKFCQKLFYFIHSKNHLSLLLQTKRISIGFETVQQVIV